MQAVNRSLADAAMDDIDHALGRPEDPLGGTYRNKYAATKGTPEFQHMVTSPHWRQTYDLGDDMHYFTVTKEGRQALADYLAMQSI